MRENDEAFAVELFSPTGASLDDARHTADVTIVDDEPVLVEVADRVIPAPIEGATTVAFTISAPQLAAGQTVTVPWAVSAPWQEHPAPHGVSGAGVVELNDGQSSVEVHVVVDATAREPVQHFLVDVAGATATPQRPVLATRGLGTIVTAAPDPDPVAVIEGPTRVPEGTTATFSAARSTATGSLAYAWDLDGDGEFDDAASADVAVPFSAFGAATVAVRVEDERGATATAARTVTIDNVPPTVQPIDDAALTAGERLSVHGRFVDPGANVWRATVDYGTGEEPVTLDGDRFTLDRVFDRPGVFTAVVRVCDDGDCCGSTPFTVSVSPAAPEILTIVPSDGPTSGGTRVTLTGTDLLFEPSPLRDRAQPTISFGGRAGTDVQCVRLGDVDTCDVVTPEHPAGTVDVVVDTADGRRAVLDEGYRFEPRAVDPPDDPSGEPGTQPDGSPSDAAGRTPGGIAQTGIQLSPWPVVAGLLALVGGALLVLHRRSRS